MVVLDQTDTTAVGLRADRYAARLRAWDWRRTALTVLTMIPLLIGATVGFLARGVVWFAAAVAEGFIGAYSPQAAAPTDDGVT